jgi:hypothetical protein
MPLFAKPSGTAATWEPQAADSRLAQTAGANPAGVFTSDLSVSEYVLLGEAGFEPLGFVVVDLPRRAAGRPVVTESGTPDAHPGHVQRQGACDGQDARGVLNRGLTRASAWLDSPPRAPAKITREVCVFAATYELVTLDRKIQVRGRSARVRA